MDSHPGMNSMYVSCFDSTILLLEIPHCLNGIHSSKGENPQYEEQKKAENA